MRLIINPIPFIPFPLIRGRGRFVLREAKPLFDSPLINDSLIVAQKVKSAYNIFVGA